MPRYFGEGNKTVHEIGGWRSVHGRLQPGPPASAETCLLAAPCLVPQACCRSVLHCTAWRSPFLLAYTVEHRGRKGPAHALDCLPVLPSPAHGAPKPLLLAVATHAQISGHAALPSLHCQHPPTCPPTHPPLSPIPWPHPSHLPPTRAPGPAEWVYMLESGFLEMLLQSGHRTLDPEEAGELLKDGVTGPRQGAATFVACWGAGLAAGLHLALQRAPRVLSSDVQSCSPPTLQTTFTCLCSSAALSTPSGKLAAGRALPCRLCCVARGLHHQQCCLVGPRITAIQPTTLPAFHPQRPDQLVNCTQFAPFPRSRCCRDTADSLRDFFYYTGQNRAMGGVNMILEAYHWIRAHFPYWCAAPPHAPHGSDPAMCPVLRAAARPAHWFACPALPHAPPVVLPTSAKSSVGCLERLANLP